MPTQEVTEDALPPGMMRLRRRTTGFYSALTTTALVAAASTCDLEKEEGNDRHREILDEFYGRWEPWIRTGVTKWAARLGLPLEEHHEEIRGNVAKKMSAGALTRIESPKAWGKYVGEILRSTSFDLWRKVKPFEPPPEEVSLDETVDGVPKTQLPVPGNQSEHEYELIRLEVLVLSDHDYRPLQAFDLYFPDGRRVSEVAATMGVPERTAERWIKNGSGFLAEAAEKFGWVKLAAVARERAKSLKGTK